MMGCLAQVSATEFTGDITGLPFLPVPIVELPVLGFTRRYVAAGLTNTLGSDVTSWVDVNGVNPLTPAGAGSGSTPPSLILDGAIRAVAFDGVLDGLGAAYALAQPFTLVFVARFVVATPSGSNLALSGGGANVFVSASVSKLQFNAGSPVTMAALATTAWHVIIATANGATSSLRQDATILTGSAGTAAKTEIILGRLSTAGSAAQCNVAEVAVYPTALITADQDALVTSLKARYGIA